MDPTLLQFLTLLFVSLFSLWLDKLWNKPLTSIGKQELKHAMKSHAPTTRKTTVEAVMLLKTLARSEEIRCFYRITLAPGNVVDYNELEDIPVVVDQNKRLTIGWMLVGLENNFRYEENKQLATEKCKLGVVKPWPLLPLDTV